MKYLVNECKKSISIVGVVAMLTFLLFGNMFIYMLYDNNGADWRANAASEKEYYVEALKQVESQGEDELGIASTCVEQMSIIDYSLANDIPYQSVSVFENISKNSILANFVVIIISLVAYNLICVEFSNDTWKNVVIFNSGNYKKILAKKRMASYVAMFGMILMFMLVAILFGAVVYKDWSNIVLEYRNGTIIESTYNNDIVDMAAGLVVRGCFYSGLAFLLASLFKDKKIGVVVLVLLVIFESSIYELIRKFNISDFLPFNNLNVLMNVTDYTATAIVGATAIVVAYVVLMEMGAYYALKRS